jgi:hypothetical protein
VTYPEPTSGLPFPKPSFILFIHLIEAELLLEDRSVGFFHAETHIPAEPPPPLEGARLSHAHEDEAGPRGHLPAPGQRAQAGFCKARISRIGRL